MADLGAIGVKAQNIGAKIFPHDTAFAWNAALNPSLCIYNRLEAIPKYEDQKTISGLVKNRAGVPLQRTVRVYNRSTGQFLAGGISDASTGAFSIKVPITSEVKVIVLPNPGDARNALIYDMVLPV